MTVRPATAYFKHAKSGGKAPLHFRICTPGVNIGPPIVLFEFISNSMTSITLDMCFAEIKRLELLIFSSISQPIAVTMDCGEVELKTACKWVTQYVLIVLYQLFSLNSVSSYKFTWLCAWF